MPRTEGATRSECLATSPRNSPLATPRVGKAPAPPEGAGCFCGFPPGPKTMLGGPLESVNYAGGPIPLSKALLVGPPISP